MMAITTNIRAFSSSKEKYWGMANAPATINTTVRKAVAKTQRSDMTMLLVQRFWIWCALLPQEGSKTAEDDSTGSRAASAKEAVFPQQRPTAGTPRPTASVCSAGL